MAPGEFCAILMRSVSLVANLLNERITSNGSSLSPGKRNLSNLTSTRVILRVVVAFASAAFW